MGNGRVQGIRPNAEQDTAVVRIIHTTPNKDDVLTARCPADGNIADVHHVESVGEIVSRWT